MDAFVFTVTDTRATLYSVGVSRPSGQATPLELSLANNNLIGKYKKFDVMMPAICPARLTQRISLLDVYDMSNKQLESRGSVQVLLNHGVS